MHIKKLPGCSVVFKIHIIRTKKNGICKYNNQLSTSAQQFLLLLDWTTCFDRLIGHPQVLLYGEVSREQCASFGIPNAFV
jgi:hypothetical protein